MKKAVVKPKKTYATLMYIPEDESTVRSFRVHSWMPKAFAITAGGLAAITLTCIAFISFGAMQYNNNTNELESLRKINNYQKDQIAQLEQNALEVEKLLKENTAALNEVKSAVGIKVKSTDSENANTPSIDISLESSSDNVMKESKRFSFVAAAAKLSNLKDALSKLKGAVTGQKQEIASSVPTIKKQLAYIRSIPNIQPVLAKITCNFGYRKNPFTSRGSEFHKGVDFGVSYGTTVHATADGVVKFAGRQSGYGRMVVIDHGNGVMTSYAHNSKLLVKTGDKVKKNQPVSLSGNNGRSTGPHLHYEVQVNGVNVNPENYFK